MLKPLAIAINSGLALQLPLVLVVFHCFLALFGHRSRTVSRKRRAIPELTVSAR